jgi:hypothetical protein
MKQKGLVSSQKLLHLRLILPAFLQTDEGLTAESGQTALQPEGFYKNIPFSVDRRVATA